MKNVLCLLCLLAVTNAIIYTCQCEYSLKKVSVGNNLFVWADGECLKQSFNTSNCHCDYHCNINKPQDFKYVTSHHCHYKYENNTLDTIMAMGSVIGTVVSMFLILTCRVSYM